MTQVNYAAMSDKELKRYFLQHREDRVAMQVYFSRLEARPHRVVTTIGDPDFSVKIEAAVQRQIRESDHSGEAEA
jgi:predicted metal-dependent RNase